jgi:hypothetical protein
MVKPDARIVQQWAGSPKIAWNGRSWRTELFALQFYGNGSPPNFWYPLMTYTAIFNCDLFTPDERIAQGLVLIEGCEIRAVGRSHEIPLPVNTRLIDARGGRVTPGLIDLGGVEWEGRRVEALGITSHLLRVSVHDESDLQKVERAAADLPSPTHSARALGLHVVGSWSPDANSSPHWQDVWTASDATVKLITLGFQSPGGGQDYAICRNFGDHLPEVGPGDSDEDWTADDAQVALWGAPDKLEKTPASHLLATLDQLRSTDRSILRSLLASHRLILTGDRVQPLSTRSIRQLMALADIDFAPALAAATLAPASFLGSPLGRLAAGAPADLICWTRHGDLAWTMVNGEIVHPGSQSSSVRQQPQRGLQVHKHDSERKQQAISGICRFLQGRSDTIALHLVGDKQRDKRRGIDLRWRFRREDGGEETITIGVQVDGAEDSESISFTTGGESSKTPACSLEHTQADWCFYYASASQRLVCLPVQATRAWLREQRVESRSDSGGAFKIPIADLQAAIPRFRRLRLEPEPGAEENETD